MHGHTPLVIDCFAGAGGLVTGLMQAGFVPGAAFDSSVAAVATYRRNVNAHILEARAEEISGEILMGVARISKGECTLVCGGPPCQGFSRQRRGGDVDERNNLVFEFLRVVDEIHPEFFLMENVSAIRGKRGAHILARLMKESHSAGYEVSLRVLDAADYGVPQHRKRAFLIGERNDYKSCFKFPNPTHDKHSWLSVRNAIGDLPSPEKNSEIYANHELDNISDLNRLRISHVPPGGGRADIPEHLRLPCHRVDVETAGHRGVYGRLLWDEPAGTITTKCNSFTRGRFAHPEQNRNITMREAARLQGFDDSFIFCGNRVDVAHQIGNAVPPPLAFSIGRAILKALTIRQGELVEPDDLGQFSLPLSAHSL